MGTFHQEVVVAQNGLATLVSTTVDNHVLTDGIVVANHYLTLLTGKVEILWEGSDNGCLEHLIIITHASTVHDAHEWIDGTVVADDHIVLDIGEWIYLAVVSNLSLWRNLCLWTYYTSHNYKLLIINYKLLSSSTQCIVEVHYCLHLVEVISYLRKLYVEQ